MKLFAYGTLVRKGRMEALIGRKLSEPAKAVLPGFKKHPTPRGYPIILPDANSQVEGVLWDIEEADLPSLDHYEGTDEDPPFYTRQQVEVDAQGERLTAWVYVGNPDIYWDIEGS